MANATFEKKLKVAVDIEIGRQYRWPTRYLIPSISSRSIEGESASRSGTSSGLRIVKRKLADQRELIAAAGAGYGAGSAWTSSPPRPGPRTCAPERVISSLAFPSTSWSRATIDGRYDVDETTKNTVSV